MANYTPNGVLITGGFGFIGSHVLTALVRDSGGKYPVVNVDKRDYCSSLKNVPSDVMEAEWFTDYQGSVNDAELLRSIFAKHSSLDTVLHFAAQSHVDNSFGNSVTFSENNIVGTHVLLECCRQAGGIRKFIHVSTDEVYGESNACVHQAAARFGSSAQTVSTSSSSTNESSCKEKVPLETNLTEEAVLSPTNPYAATKAAAEFLVRAYGISFKLPVIITRGNNVYGPNQYPEKLIPKFSLLAKRGIPTPVHGNGSNSRNFVHVDDTVAAFRLILTRGEVGQVYNIGTDFEISNLEVARAIWAYFGEDGTAEEKGLITFVEDRPFNDARYRIDASKIEALGWTPKIGWKEGLAKTISWYCEEGRAESHWPRSIESALVPHPRLPYDGRGEGDRERGEGGN